MTPERWDAVERLYHAALECGPDQRDRFLAGACDGDEALRADVESLLAHGLAAPDFLASPPADNLRAAIAARLDHRVSAPGQFVGQTFGPYSIVTWLASGGMGDVYRAVDTRLNRPVAVKVLPQHPRCDPERQLRFRREAEIVSNLNHPHVCTVHDIGVHDGVDYIVMEYIDGETLQQRLAAGALPLARALEYSVQIVDALDKAHRRGVVHRDLKPGNVMITTAGIKLLDFGVATRMAAPTAGLGDAANPTTHGAMAQEPAMATPRYASPEQLEGKGVDARTDIFSFGATAYEMVTGRPAFEGDTRSGVIRSVLQEEPPPIRELAPAVPNAVARTLARCLAKDPDERWQTASDLLFELRSLVADSASEKGVAIGSAARSPWVERAWWLAVLAAALFLTLMFTASGRAPEPPQPSAGDLRFDVWPEAGTAFAASFDVPFALAPDGRTLAYVAVGDDGVRRLWLRRFDGASERAQQIAGTEDANTPFWSPDGAWVGFFSRQRLLKVRVSNARVQTVATHAASMAGATWGADGVILFPTGPGGLSRISADGGPVSAATAGDGSHFWPQFIGDGRRFLYAAARTNEIRLGSLSGESSRLLMKVPLRISSLGYTREFIFFGQDASLFARAFDERTLEVSGEPIELLTGIPITQLGRMPFSISGAGPLAFWRYAGGTPATLQWLTEDGRIEPAVGTPARYVGFDLAPDGRRLAFSRRNVDGGADVWIRDLRTSAETRLTFHGFAFAPRWSPDGRRLAFTATYAPALPRLFVKDLSQAGAEAEFTASPLATFASSWCRDGERIVSVRIDPSTRDDLYVEHLRTGTGERLPFNTAGNDYQGVLSPDDRWLAFVTDASGRDEVWVASFPSGRVSKRVSTSGGSPQWTSGGNEIAYITEGRWLTVRSFTGTTDATITLGNPRPLSPAGTFVETTGLLTPSANSYVSAVGPRRFLAAVRANDSRVPPLQLIVDWRALLPAK